MLVTPEFCCAALRYIPETGKLYWNERPVELFADAGRGGAAGTCARWNAKCAGKEAFKCTHVAWGHKQGTIGGKSFKAHHVIWAIVYGEWPTHQIDHINGDPADNRIANLRDVSAAENVRNSSRYQSNKSGYSGVYWSAKNRRWIASIKDRAGKPVYLGSFQDVDEAGRVRKRAEREHGYHPNHGRDSCLS